MKQLLLSCLILVGLSLRVAGQAPWKSPLPIDSTTQRVTYSGVMEVPGASKAELYSRAREWFAITFRSSKAVLEMDDREVGKLIGNSYAQFGFNGSISRPLDWAMWRRIKVEIKDGKYRYTISDFTLGGPVATPSETLRPIEPWLASATAKGKQPGKMVLSVVKGVESTGQAEAASLRAAMSKKTGGDF